MDNFIQRNTTQDKKKQTTDSEIKSLYILCECIDMKFENRQN